MGITGRLPNLSRSMESLRQSSRLPEALRESSRLSEALRQSSRLSEALRQSSRLSEALRESQDLTRDLYPFRGIDPTGAFAQARPALGAPQGGRESGPPGPGPCGPRRSPDCANPVGPRNHSSQPDCRYGRISGIIVPKCLNSRKANSEKVLDGGQAWTLIFGTYFSRKVGAKGSWTPSYARATFPPWNCLAARPERFSGRGGLGNGGPT